MKTMTLTANSFALLNCAFCWDDHADNDNGRPQDSSITDMEDRNGSNDRNERWSPESGQDCFDNGNQGFDNSFGVPDRD